MFALHYSNLHSLLMTVMNCYCFVGIATNDMTTYYYARRRFAAYIANHFRCFGLHAHWMFDEAFIV
jgi:hypothetical protein